MLDFAAARRHMVDGQVRTADVTDGRLLSAMFELPREQFVPEGRASLAYLDLDFSVGEHGAFVRRLVRPMVLAKLIQAAKVTEFDHVLDIGCATGYSTALLSRLAKSVVGLEEAPALVRRAGEALAGIGAANAKIVSGPLPAGCPKEGPYDLIFVQGAVEFVPAQLWEQLKDDGRLACILGGGPGSNAMIYSAMNGNLAGHPVFQAAATLLPGFAKPREFVF